MRPIDPESIRQRAIAAGIPYQVAIQRVRRLGWSVDEALSKPVAPMPGRMTALQVRDLTAGMKFPGFEPRQEG